MQDDFFLYMSKPSIFYILHRAWQMSAQDETSHHTAVTHSSPESVRVKSSISAAAAAALASC